MFAPFLDTANVSLRLRRDDPICVWENVEEHASNIEQNPYLALAELQLCSMRHSVTSSYIDAFVYVFTQHGHTNAVSSEP